MSTYKLTLEYDGTAYAGWQYQPDQPTVQACLESVLLKITQTPVSVIAAGRTDAGVHALGQVVSFYSNAPFDLSEWGRALNGLLPRDIVVKHIDPVSDSFHARYHAVEKIYEYRILNHPCRSALDRYRVWHVPKMLNISAMEEAATFLIGTHNFSSFQGSRTEAKNPVCTVTRLTIGICDSTLKIQVQANRFLKHMVRSLVGTLVEIGHEKRRPTDISNILHAANRQHAGQTAPPHGLYLLQVIYNDITERSP